MHHRTILDAAVRGVAVVAPILSLASTHVLWRSETLHADIEALDAPVASAPRAPSHSIASS